MPVVIVCVMRAGGDESGNLSFQCSFKLEMSVYAGERNLPEAWSMCQLFVPCFSALTGV